MLWADYVDFKKNCIIYTNSQSIDCIKPVLSRFTESCPLSTIDMLLGSQSAFIVNPEAFNEFILSCYSVSENKDESSILIINDCINLGFFSNILLIVIFNILRKRIIIFNDKFLEDSLFAKRSILQYNSEKSFKYFLNWVKLTTALLIYKTKKKTLSFLVPQVLHVEKIAYGFPEGCLYQMNSNKGAQPFFFNPLSCPSYYKKFDKKDL